jgi:hypothetical protein
MSLLLELVMDAVAQGSGVEQRGHGRFLVLAHVVTTREMLADANDWLTACGALT